MVINSLLPNILNVAQIVNIVSPPIVETIRNKKETENDGSLNYKKECTPELIALQSSQILNNIFRDDLYDKHLTPDPLGVNVSIELALQTFYDISELSASFTADVLMSQIWLDRRLRYTYLGSCIENMTLSSVIVERFWQPFVCFVNSKKSELHVSPSPNTFVLIYPNGTVWMNYRLRVEGPCYVDLWLYPFNEEECELVLESYAYNAANVRLMWRDWNPLTVNFLLTRQFGVYLFQMYFPAQTAVAMSWIPFFLDYRSLPARITLSVSALMSITFQYGNILKSLPRVSYVMSVDVWIFGSIAFIASSLIELAIVGHLHRKYRSRNFRRKSTLLLEQEQDMLHSISQSDAALNISMENSFIPTDIEDNLFENSNISTKNNRQKINGYGTFLLKRNNSKRSSMRRNYKLNDQNNKRIFKENEEKTKIEYKQIELLKYLKMRANKLINNVKRNCSDPVYWDERARIYFPLSYFFFNVAYWTYYVGYHKILRQKFLNSNMLSDA
uniref:Uncharacterized protein n=1 Tax=Meloidogyne incognita TaxID=6306 RepID=A0A914N0W3_MELIC